MLSLLSISQFGWMVGSRRTITTTKGEIEYEFIETPVSAERWIDHRVKRLVRAVHLQGKGTLFFDQNSE
jgi:hypothetical protein